MKKFKDTFLETLDKVPDSDIHDKLRKMGSPHHFSHGGIGSETKTAFHGNNSHHDAIHKMALEHGYTLHTPASAANKYVSTYHKTSDGRNVQKLSISKHPFTDHVNSVGTKTDVKPMYG